MQQVNHWWNHKVSPSWHSLSCKWKITRHSVPLLGSKALSPVFKGKHEGLQGSTRLPKPLVTAGVEQNLVFCENCTKQAQNILDAWNEKTTRKKWVRYLLECDCWASADHSCSSCGPLHHGLKHSIFRWDILLSLWVITFPFKMVIFIWRVAVLFRTGFVHWYASFNRSWCECQQEKKTSSFGARKPWWLILIGLNY